MQDVDLQRCDTGHPLHRALRERPLAGIGRGAGVRQGCTHRVPPGVGFRTFVSVLEMTDPSADGQTGSPVFRRRVTPLNIVYGAGTAPGCRSSPSFRHVEGHSVAARRPAVSPVALVIAGWSAAAAQIQRFRVELP